MRQRIAVAALCRLTLAAALLGPLAGCGVEDFWSYPPQVRGNKIDPDDLAQLVVGTSTQKDVTALLGSPTAKGSFDENSWIYISQVTSPVIGATQGVWSQHVYEITFDDKGVLRSIKKRTQDDSLPVAVVERTTPSPGTEASFMQQLRGNVGRFNPVGEAQPSQLGEPTSGQGAGY